MGWGPKAWAWTIALQSFPGVLAATTCHAVCSCRSPDAMLIIIKVMVKGPAMSMNMSGKVWMVSRVSMGFWHVPHDIHTCFWHGDIMALSRPHDLRGWELDEFHHAFADSHPLKWESRKTWVYAANNLHPKSRLYGCSHDVVLSIYDRFETWRSGFLVKLTEEDISVSFEKSTRWRSWLHPWDPIPKFYVEQLCCFSWHPRTRIRWLCTL